MLIADSASLGVPRIVPCELREIEHFVTLSDVTEAVVGVRVRIRSEFLRNLVLIDTPGVGGLVAGHSRTTLAALGRADALLFFCVRDAQQPILAPEIKFLCDAVQKVPRLVVAITKCDKNPAFEEVVALATRDSNAPPDQSALGRPSFFLWPLRSPISPPKLRTSGPQMS